MAQHTGHRTDFDFLHGTWNVTNRRLRQRFAGCDEWDVFDGTARCWPLLDGLANVDEMRCPDHGVSGATVRCFDLETSQWSIHWISGSRGRLDPPVLGGFDGPIGRFEGQDVDEGRTVAVRFLWTVTDDDTARWSQAFSLDGEDWEDNWTMDFSRLG